LANDEVFVIASNVSDIEILRLSLRYIQIIQAQIDLVREQYFLNLLILISLCWRGGSNQLWHICGGRAVWPASHIETLSIKVLLIVIER